MEDNKLLEYKVNIYTQEGEWKVRNAMIYHRNEEVARARVIRDPYWYRPGDRVNIVATGKTND